MPLEKERFDLNVAWDLQAYLEPAFADDAGKDWLWRSITALRFGDGPPPLPAKETAPEGCGSKQSEETANGEERPT